MIVLFESYLLVVRLVLQMNESFDQICLDVGRI